MNTDALIQTKYQGYFFNPDTEELLSNKRKGKLLPMKMTEYDSPGMVPSKTGLIHGEKYWRVSHNLKEEYLTLNDLKMLRRNV